MPTAHGPWLDGGKVLPPYGCSVPTVSVNATWSAKPQLGLGLFWSAKPQLGLGLADAKLGLGWLMPSWGLAFQLRGWGKSPPHPL